MKNFLKRVIKAIITGYIIKFIKDKIDSKSFKQQQ